MSVLTLDEMTAGEDQRPILEAWNPFEECDVPEQPQGDLPKETAKQEPNQLSRDTGDSSLHE